MIQKVSFNFLFSLAFTQLGANHLAPIGASLGSTHIQRCAFTDGAVQLLGNGVNFVIRHLAAGRILRSRGKDQDSPQKQDKGDKTKALESVTEDLRTAMRWNEIYPLLMAECYALINETEEALHWLEVANRWGCINYPFLIEHDPFLENLQGEERFKKLMERVKYEWEHFEV